MEKKYKDFLMNKKLNEPRTIFVLSKSNGYGITDLKKYFGNNENNLETFIEYYEKNMCSFEQEVINVDIERVMEDASVDCSYELLQDSKYADAGSEQLDKLIDASQTVLVSDKDYNAFGEEVDAKLIRM